MPNQKEILFGGMGDPGTPGAFENKTGENNQTTPGEKGLTLLQIWRMQAAVFGTPSICLLAKGQPKVSANGIKRTISFTPQQLADTVIQLFIQNKTTSLITLYYDGKTGHCITLTGFDEQKNRITYHDPWPDNSLLCKENNTAGIEAQSAGDRVWSITPEELAKIIFASFVSPKAWAKLQDEHFEFYYSDFIKSDFHSFFYVREKSRQPDGGFSTIKLETGGFKEFINLSIKINNGERICGASLVLQSDWIIGEPQGINPFACDVTSSFVSCFTPKPDEANDPGIAKTIMLLPSVEIAKAIYNEGYQKSVIHEFFFAYIGLLEQAVHCMDFSILTFKNEIQDNKQSLKINFDLNTI